MNEVNEGRLTLKFSEKSWEIVKYDDCIEFKETIRLTQNIKGVDIIGIYNKETIYLIEIKDFKGYESKKTQEWCDDLNCLTNDLTQKIKDTLIGVFCIQRNKEISSNYWNSICNSFVNNNVFNLVFWIEGDLSKYSKNFRKTLLLSNLKQKLKCFNSKVIITNSNLAMFSDAECNYK